MKILSFISRKGGTGKTTNAINLATTLHQRGNKVLLVETDTNYTLNTLRKIESAREKNVTTFDIVGSQDATIAEELQQVKQNNRYDFVIVDSAGKTTDEGIKKLCLVSDAAIVPTSLTQNDLLVTYQTVTDLLPAQKLNPALKILILPNRIHSFTRQKTVTETLSKIQAIVLPVMVPQKNAFVNFSTVEAEKEYQIIADQILLHIQ
ncbi:MAG: AAA family ATPase [Chryseotalea sp.]|jgi:chromosome partitioning protein|nr:ParA family protein [Flammeovirgaceae bacterium]